MKKIYLLLVILCLSGCSSTKKNYETMDIKPGDDVRSFEYKVKSFDAGTFYPEDIYMFVFNKASTFKGSEDIAEAVLENGKNPGLGIRTLHEQGITGEGINVAIIDQNLLLDHQEYKDKIVEYYDTGCDTSIGSMHGPAVASLLVGESTGVAPGANVYYAAAPSWKADSEYYAKALEWIVEKNRELPEGNKIRVVSISAAPSGTGSPFKYNQELYTKAVELALNEGIMVIDCRSESTGFIGPAYYDPTDPDNIKKCKYGWPNVDADIPKEFIGVPCSFRTVAECYSPGEQSYAYWGTGGLSWSIPYAAGVFALGWQVNPELSNETMLSILNQTAYIKKDGSKIINPVAFVDAVKLTLK